MVSISIETYHLSLFLGHYLKASGICLETSEMVVKNVDFIDINLCF